MKLIVYALVRLLFLTTHQLQLAALLAGGVALGACAVLILHTLIKATHAKVRAFLQLRRARQQLALLEQRLAADASRPTPQEPYRSGPRFFYQKELEHLLAPLDAAQGRALLRGKLSAPLREALQSALRRQTE